MLPLEPGSLFSPQGSGLPVASAEGMLWALGAEDNTASAGSQGSAVLGTQAPRNPDQLRLGGHLERLRVPLPTVPAHTATHCQAGREEASRWFQCEAPAALASGQRRRAVLWSVSECQAHRVTASSGLLCSRRTGDRSLHLAAGAHVFQGALRPRRGAGSLTSVPSSFPQTSLSHDATVLLP